MCTSTQVGSSSESHGCDLRLLADLRAFPDRVVVREEHAPVIELGEAIHPVVPNPVSNRNGPRGWRIRNPVMTICWPLRRDISIARSGSLAASSGFGAGIV